LGGRKGIRPVKTWGVVGLEWRPPGLSVPSVSIVLPSLHKNPEDTEEARMEYKKSRQNARRDLFSKGKETEGMGKRLK